MKDDLGIALWRFLVLLVVVAVVMVGMAWWLV